MKQLSDVSVLVIPGMHIAGYGHVQESGPHNSCPRLIPKEWNAFRSDTIDLFYFTQSHNRCRQGLVLIPKTSSVQSLG
jgi:hypothetical protein